jgi:hypothetical protein
MTSVSNIIDIGRCRQYEGKISGDARCWHAAMAAAASAAYHISALVTGRQYALRRSGRIRRAARLTQYGVAGAAAGIIES